MHDKNTHIITRKIQLRINTHVKAEEVAHWQTLRNWQYNCFRAANYIMTHHFIQEQLKDICYVTDELHVKLADMHTDTDGILNTSKHNTTYRLLSKLFKEEMPMHILSCLNHTLVTHFQKEKEQYRLGEKSLRNYKRNIPVPFKAEDLRHLRIEADKKDYEFKKLLLQQLTEKKIVLCNSALALEDQKLFLLACCSKTTGYTALDENTIAEASLSIEYPIVLTINKQRYTIGDKETLLYRRLAIQQARQRLQKAVVFHKGGHGKTRKIKKLAAFSTAEHDYVNTMLHTYSRKLVELCIKHNAATLLLSDQQEKETVAKEDSFLLRNWSYDMLKERVLYKAKRAGITVIVE